MEIHTISIYIYDFCCQAQIQSDLMQITVWTVSPVIQMTEVYQSCLPSEWFIVTKAGDSMGAKDNMATN